ncbi:hypothetical protein [Aureimonas mangrovi]|nr:hypothetical protein [Aureimonas mangrovi]
MIEWLFPNPQDGSVETGGWLHALASLASLPLGGLGAVVILIAMGVI